jgi:outer membrane biosynthesis protein TonB
METERAKPLQPTPKAPVVAKPIEDGADEKPVRPKDVVDIGPKPDEAAQKPVEARAEQKPGDLAMTKPGPEQKAVDKPAAPNMPEGEPKKPRPRTVAAALAQMDNKNPYSALAGQKLAQEGGVRRFSVSPSLDVKGTPIGNYDARLVNAVQECWWALLEQQRYSLDRLGVVMIEFRLTMDGRIADMKVVESDVGDIYTTICQLAITKPSPYEKWPADMRRLVGSDSRLVRFTFYY